MKDAMAISHIGCDVGSWMGIFIVALLLLAAMALWQRQFKAFVDKISSWLFWIALCIWGVGVGVYMIGYYNPEFSGWAIVPRAVLSAFRMFLVNNDLARVDKVFQVNPTYMVVFSIAHFFAALISFLFVVKLIGFRFWALLNLWIKSWLGHKTVYVFWGINDASLQLAESIREHEKIAKQTHSLIAFVHTNDINEKGPNAQVGMVKIIDLMNMRFKDETRILDIDKVAITNCHSDLGSVESTRNVKQFFRELNLKCLGRIVRNTSDLHLFFLADDEEKNISSAVKMRDLFAVSPDVPTNVTLYAHARRSTKNEIYNYYSLYAAGCEADKKPVGTEKVDGEKKIGPESLKIKLIDSSNLAVTYLKQHFDHHPVHLVDIDHETATVTSPFNALIIGFGEVGRDAFRFLYEFGAFAGKDGLRSPFHCHAIDANMHQIEGNYRLSTSGIVDKHLTLVDTAIGTERYREVLQTIIGTLNCVVITINDDDLAMATAVRLYRQAVQARGNQLSKFRIYVHCRDKRHWKRMQDVAEKFNTCNALSNGTIVIFGNPKDLYTYDLIVDDKIEKEAMRYHKLYQMTAPIFLSVRDQAKGVTEKQRRQVIGAKDEHTLWRESFETDAIKLFKNKYKFCISQCEQACKDKLCRSLLHEVHDIIRKREQNIANTLHMKTKTYLLLGDKYNDCEALNPWEKIAKSRESGTTEYQATDQQKKKLKNLACCEHIRWEAAHQLMGYEFGASNSSIAKTHKDMRPWVDLSELTKSYDCNVVDTSIKLLCASADNHGLQNSSIKSNVKESI